MSLLLTSACLLFATVFGAAEQPTCGGIQGLLCPDSMTCTYDRTCDPATGSADCTGTCQASETCGGFVGLTCSDKDQVCADDPYDDCDPLNGGADCIGICIYPGDSCSICDMSMAMGAPAGMCPDGTCFGNCGTCTWELTADGDAYCSRLVPQDRVCPVTTTVAATTTTAPGCLCTKEYIPLCCRGQTYGNLCMAECDGFGAGDCSDGECPTTTSTDTTAACCDVADRNVLLCREGCACCPDGTWAGSIGDGNTFTCNGVELKKDDTTAVFGTICETTTEGPTTTTTSSGCPCTKEYVPLCCGGQTYGNLCEAECDGFAVGDCSDGECPTTTSTDTTAACCDVADRNVLLCREGCACCPDGTWAGSIGDANTFTCNGVELKKDDTTAVFGTVCETTTERPTTSGTDTTRGTEVCCDEADKDANACWEGCACCPDGTWVGSIGDGKTYPCNNGELTLVVGQDRFGTVCETTTTQSGGCVCYEIYDPYCCEDTTYGNDCFAECEGGYNVTADCSKGECSATSSTEEPTSTDAEICSSVKRAYAWLTESAICKLCLYPGMTRTGVEPAVCQKVEELAMNEDVQECVSEICDCPFELLSLKSADEIGDTQCSCEWLECMRTTSSSNRCSVFIAVAFMLFMSAFSQ